MFNEICCAHSSPKQLNLDYGRITCKKLSHSLFIEGKLTIKQNEAP